MFSKKVSLLYKITMLVLTITMLILTILPSGVAVTINTSSESINKKIIYDYFPYYHMVPTKYFECASFFIFVLSIVALGVFLNVFDSNSYRTKWGVTGLTILYPTIGIFQFLHMGFFKPTIINCFVLFLAVILSIISILFKVKADFLKNKMSI